MNRLFYKTGRRFFSNHYHHDFEPGHIPKTTLYNVGLVAFDGARLLLYLFLTIKLTMKAPSFIFFRKNKFTNNPDYMLYDQTTIEKALTKHI
jgi:hypothetical protein